jgi:hypothetical protein
MDTPLIFERQGAVLKAFGDDSLACMVESTYNWYWLDDCLIDAGFGVRLAS